MDNYTKYGILAAGAIGVYLWYRKDQGLNDEVRDDSYEELAKNDPSLSGVSKRKKSRGKSGKSLAGWSEKKGKFLTLTTENKGLTISLTERAKNMIEEARREGEDPTSDRVMYFDDWWEDIQANSDWIYIDDAADAGLAMSNTPLFLEGWYYDEAGYLEEGSAGRMYYDPRYQIEDFREALIERGTYHFRLLTDSDLRGLKQSKKRKKKSSKLSDMRSLRVGISMPSGAIEVAAEKDGRSYRQKYYDYTVREAKAAFREYVKEEEAKIIRNKRR